MKKILGLVLALSFLAFLSALPAHAAANPPAPAVAATATAQPGCQPRLDLGKLASAKAEACSAAAPALSKIPEPEFLVGTRTCRCSCGFPCKTDADCGGGVGSCRAGITCC